MRIYKVISAACAAALLLALMLGLPGFSANVEASTGAPLVNAVVKGDRLDIRPLGMDCSQQAWPYYEPGCMRDRRLDGGIVRPVRLLTPDRQAR
jgi:hypothetical protein